MQHFQIYVKHFVIFILFISWNGVGGAVHDCFLHCGNKSKKNISKFSNNTSAILYYAI